MSKQQSMNTNRNRKEIPKFMVGFGKDSSFFWFNFFTSFFALWILNLDKNGHFAIVLNTEYKKK